MLIRSAPSLDVAEPHGTATPDAPAADVRPRSRVTIALALLSGSTAIITAVLGVLTLAP